MQGVNGERPGTRIMVMPVLSPSAKLTINYAEISNLHRTSQLSDPKQSLGQDFRPFGRLRRPSAAAVFWRGDMTAL